MTQAMFNLTIGGAANIEVVSAEFKSERGEPISQTVEVRFLQRIPMFWQPDHRYNIIDWSDPERCYKINH
jgi:hypothetical protein